MELFRLTTSKAYSTSYDTQKGQSISSLDWTTSSSQVIDYYWTVYGVNSQSWRVTGFNLSGRYHGSYGNDDVYYTVIIRDSNGAFLYQSADTHIGEPLEFTLSSTNKQGAEVAYNIQVRMFRLNGANIYTDSLPASSVTLFINVTDNVSENTQPAAWYTTVTNNIDDPFQTMTTVVPPEMDFTDTDLSPLVTIPEKITLAINLFLMSVGQLLQLKYMTFTICFVLIVGLFAWLLH